MTFLNQVCSYTLNLEIQSFGDIDDELGRSPRLHSEKSNEIDNCHSSIKELNYAIFDVRFCLIICGRSLPRRN